MAKSAAHLAGYPIPGHTEFLRTLAGAPIVRMAFVSPRLSVVLHTVHQSLRSVVEDLDAEAVAETLAFSASRFIQLTGNPDLRVALSANFGEDPTDGYEEIFLKHLAEARDRARTFIRAYRLHGEVNQVYAEVYGAIGDLLKFAAYTLGNADGRRIEVVERANLTAALAGHWFEPFFKRLHEACRAIGEHYDGRWTDKTSFEAIGDIADEAVVLCGIKYRYLPGGQLYLDIP
jgi:hypothetical protein